MLGGSPRAGSAQPLSEGVRPLSQGLGPPLLSQMVSECRAFVTLTPRCLCNKPCLYPRPILSPFPLGFSVPIWTSPKGQRLCSQDSPGVLCTWCLPRAQYQIAPHVNFRRHLWRDCPAPLNKPGSLLRSSLGCLNFKTRCDVLRTGPPREPKVAASVSCLPGRPGLPRELGAAHHRLGARGRLHLLPEAAAAPDD